MKHIIYIACMVAACGRGPDDDVTTSETTQAVDVLNGSFESDYAGWTLFETPGSPTAGTWGIATDGQTIVPGQQVFDFHDNTLVQQGSPGLPITYDATAGTKVAFQLQTGPQNHRMFQTVTLPACQPLLLWDMSYRNHQNNFDAVSQFAAVNIRNPSNDAIIATPFKTAGSDPQVVAAMTPFQVDLSAFSAQTIRVDFELQVQVFFFDAAWDNVRIICKGLSANPGTLAFGDVPIGGSAALSTTVTNFAQVPLTITSTPVTGPFVITGGPPLPITLQPGGTTSYQLAFQPGAVGPASGTLTLNSNDPNGATVVALSGTGLDGARIAVAPAAVAFPDVQVGDSSAAQTIVVENTGTSALNVGAPSVVGSSAFGVSSPGFPAVIAPGSTASFTVQFAPTSTGSANAVVVIGSNDPASPTQIPVSGTGVAPQITLDPTALAFADQRVGTTSAAQQVRARNAGVGALTITSITTSGPFARGAVSLPITLPPGAFVDVGVTFSPAASGAASGQLVFASTAGTSPDVTTLTGTGIEPLIDVAPSPLAFGDQRTGTTGGRALVVSNPGTATLTISSITTTGPFANANATPIAIPPGGNVTLTVTFTPPATATFAGTLTITSDAAASPTIVALSGRGVEPIASVNPASLAFGNRRVGTTSPPKSIVLSNTGTAPLLVTALGIPAPFVVTNAPSTPFVLAPGAATTIQVAFAPTAAGGASQSLVIASDAAASPMLVTCTGNGIEPVVSASATQLAFGDIRTGTTSTGQTLTITNIGTAPLAIASASAPAQFTITGPALPRTVLPNASVAFTVRFAPTADGPASGNVVVTSDAAASPTVVAVTGTGVSPAIAVAPSSHDFGDVRVGTTSAPVTVTIDNPGTSALTVTAIAVAAPFARTVVALPATIAAGGSLAFDVTFAPTARAAVVGAVAITSDAGAASTSLAGRGVAPVIEASLDPVDFGDVAIATTSTLALQLANTGDAPLVISTLALSGAHAADFAIASPPSLPATVAPGAALTLALEFTPVDHGARTAQLAVGSDATALAVGLEGAGVGAQIALDPAALDFGDVNVEVASAPRTITISNIGEIDLVVGSIVVGGAHAADFAVTASPPITIGPGGSDTVAITFTPSAIGARAATATFVSSDPLVPSAVVTLAGVGESPALSVSPSTLAYGDVRVGTTKVLPFTISNTGNGPLTITAVGVSGADAAQVSLAAVTLPLVLAPAASRVINVTFAPTVLGSASATLDVVSDATIAGTAAVPITGAGVSPTVALSPSDLDFGAQLVGRGSAPRQLRVQNTGSGPLAVLSLAIGGAQAASFTVVSPPVLPAAIAPGSELVLSVRVTPSAIGAAAATLSIGTDSPDAPNASAGLAALGISTAFSLSPSSIDFGTAHAPATGAPVAVTLSNTTGDTLTLVDGVLGGARPGDFTVSSIAGPLAAGGSVTAMVSYTAAVAATSAATLTFQTTDSTIPPAVVTLAGKAVSTFVTADRGELDFGSIQIGDASGPKSITVTNVTTAPITIASVQSADAQFVVDATAATTTIDSGASATFTVVFEPATAGPASSQVAVTLAGAPTPELSITVIGEGTAASGGGCSTTPGSSLLLVLALGALLTCKRRRGRACTPSR